MSNPEPLLSIGITACNHAGRVERAVRSALEQQTGFHYEVIVCDDASTDGTTEILERLRLAFPERLRIDHSATTRGPLENGKAFFMQARARYLCWMDADDCWTFPEKIARQVAFLEASPEYAGCFHDARIISEKPANEAGDEYEMRYHGQWKTYSQFNAYPLDYHPWHALERIIIPTASLVFRRTEMNEFFTLFGQHRLSISWAVHLWLLRQGKFRYFNETWSDYYDHAAGFSKKFSLYDFKINNISILEKLQQDPFYAGLRKDLLAALVKEHRHLLSIPGVRVIGEAAFKRRIRDYKKYQKEFIREETRFFNDRFNSES